MPAVLLLAPVPLEHLISGREVCEAQGKVAFGSRAFEVFRELDNHRNREAVTTYIYASDDPTNEKLEASWVGRFTGWVEVSNGRHPAGMLYRPPTTAKYEGDNEGHWAGFWELNQLRILEPFERIPTGKFFGYQNMKQFKKNFIPKGPLLASYVAYPSTE